MSKQSNRRRKEKKKAKAIARISSSQIHNQKNNYSSNSNSRQRATNNRDSKIVQNEDKGLGFLMRDAVGFGGGGVLAGAAFSLQHKIFGLWFTYIAVVSVVHIPFHFLVKSNAKSKPEIWTIFSLIAGALFLWGMVWSHKIYTQIPDDSDRPYLEPSLIIDSVLGGYIGYHYEIHNTGKTTAYHITQQESGDGYVHFETDAGADMLPQELDPDQKMEITEPTIWQTNSGDFSKILVLSYCDLSSDVTNYFNKQFRFFGSYDSLNVGTQVRFEESQPVEKSFITNAQQVMFDNAMRAASEARLRFLQQQASSNDINPK